MLGQAHLDENDPVSLINLVWGSMSKAIKNLLLTHPDLFELSERRLERLCKPDDQLLRVKIHFWERYNHARENNRKMQELETLHGYCHASYFLVNVERNPAMVAWFVHPPADYMSTMEALLFYGLDQMRRILKLPIKSKSGKYDNGLIGKKIQIIQMLDQRVKGSVIQKVAIKQQVEVTDTNITQDLESIQNSLDQLDANMKGHQEAMLSLPLPMAEPVIVQTRDPERRESKSRGRGRPKKYL